MSNSLSCAPARYLKSLSTIVAVASLFIGPAAVLAVPILEVEFVAGPANSTDNSGLSGRVQFEFEETLDGDLLFLTLMNTTAPELGSALTAFAWNGPLLFPAIQLRGRWYQPLLRPAHL